MLKFAIIGFGGLGKVHFNNYSKIKESGRADIELVALCDIEESAFTKAAATNITDGKALSTDAFRKYTDYKELIEKEELDYVVTALPSYLHAQVAVHALNAGLHVFSEKPMALDADSCQAMLDAAKANGKMLMIGQCVRYFPAYKKLKELIENKKYGALVRAEFKRYSAFPAWTWQDWMRDVNKSGGASLDLHVHDVDFINYLFGLPNSVYSASTHKCTGFDSVFTTYHYGDVVITATCDWGIHKQFPFTATFMARFENGTVEFDGKALTVYTDDADKADVPFGDEDGYQEEMVDFINSILSGKASEINPPESSMQSIRIVLAERESASTKKVVEF